MKHCQVSVPHFSIWELTVLKLNKNVINTLFVWIPFEDVSGEAGSVEADEPEQDEHQYVYSS